MGSSARQAGPVSGFLRKEKTMKPLKLKCALYTDDGETWICIRQFYASDVATNTIVDDQFAGMKLKRIDNMEERNDKEQRASDGQA